MKLLSLLFVLEWCMFSVVHCVSCRLLGVWVLLVDWDFPGTQFVVEILRFCFLGQIFSFKTKCALAWRYASASWKTSKTEWVIHFGMWSNEWTEHRFLKSLKSLYHHSLSLWLNRMSVCRMQSQSMAAQMKHKRLNNLGSFYFSSNEPNH